jgi:uncharacterized membrane protein YdjX (TVP38/TMEM64 family)
VDLAATDLLIVAGVVFAVNLMPAFGPPTWAVLVFMKLQLGVPAVALVAVGALAAASGRLCLARATRALRPRLSAERIRNLDALRDAATEHRGGAIAGLALFAVSPVPSAQLFMAAGLTGVRVVPLTLAFFAGRIVSYSFYVGAANAAKDSLGLIFTEVLRSPVSIAVQLALLAGVAGLGHVDWARRLARTPKRAEEHGGPAGSSPDDRIASRCEPPATIPEREVTP